MLEKNLLKEFLCSLSLIALIFTTIYLSFGSVRLIMLPSSVSVRFRLLSVFEFVALHAVGIRFDNLLSPTSTSTEGELSE